MNAKLFEANVRSAGVPPLAVGASAAGGGSATGGSAGADEAWRSPLPASDFMVGRLCEQHPGTPIVFVAHSSRYLPVRGIADTPLFPDGRVVQAACAGRPQCSFIDLRFAFSRDWATHHVRFEAADGGHWNAYANQLVARTLADFITQNHILPNGEQGRRRLRRR